ncbi:MAG: SDR family NAD(P)-dependent oxidoreductase [Acidimicrobiales bacterium]
MSWTIRDIPDQTGRVAVITGANGGLGLASAKALAGKGAHVVMAARNQAKAVAARDQILALHPEASVEIVELDLASRASIEAAAAAIGEPHDRIDVLMNNAGLMAMPQGTTVDGFETQWGVNVLGHWVLTSLLLPTIVATPGARVVWLSSVAQHQATKLKDDPQMRDGYKSWNVYSQTKLANRLMAMGLQERFEQAGIAAMSLVAHPGGTDSDLQSHTASEGGGGFQGKFYEKLVPMVGMSTDAGALSQLRAATDPHADPHKQYCPLFSFTGPPVAKPMVRPGTHGDIERLWAMNERDTGLTLAPRALPT